jgi:hypothetical protein
MSASRQLLHTPDAFFNADRIVSMTVNDGMFDSNTATAFIHVTGSGRCDGARALNAPGSWRAA